MTGHASFVPGDAAARAVGADDGRGRDRCDEATARGIERHDRAQRVAGDALARAARRGRDARTGASATARWPSTDVAVPVRRRASSTAAPHALGLGSTDEIPWLASQQRVTFARVGVVDPARRTTTRRTAGSSGCGARSR